MARGGEQKDHLTTEDIERCNVMVKDFIDTADPHKTLVMPDRLMINQCFYHFKTLYKNLERKKGGAPISGMKQEEPKAIEDTPPKNSAAQNEEIQRLNLLVKQRD